MKSPLFSPLSIAALCGMLATPAAFAASGPTLTGKLSKLKFDVIDLSPNDGVAANYRLNKESVQIENQIRHNWSSSERQTVDLNLAVGDEAFSNLNKGPLHTTIQSNGSAGDVTSEVRRDAGRALPHQSNSVNNTYTYKADLTLSPGAALLLSGNVQQQFIPAGQYIYDTAMSRLSVELKDRSSTFIHEARYSSHFSYRYNQNGWNYQGDFSLVLTNFSNTDISIGLDLAFYSGIDATQPLSAVPEPGSYALFGAGLALLGWRARRRRA
ncbi:PEP-CTERM sorting domain-containing protein [Massilia sp. BJB1822]|uniref:PEP-CTERM sorting domain-containing protein n=1 Tax=Massilia sp. BJB1822 TaxID=2744470 RepID=UPI001593D933|nr:PEP-CTERM sorting domain-containing protein [Massilia sp. BJB1822]NVD99697.1 PEP-CTERM sorting domain-containing protein [Massilia sp. BJB1822]